MLVAWISFSAQTACYGTHEKPVMGPSQAAAAGFWFCMHESREGAITVICLPHFGVCKAAVRAIGYNVVGYIYRLFSLYLK